MNGRQETDYIILKNGETYFLRDKEAREQVKNLLSKAYTVDNPPPYPVTSVNGMRGDVIVQGGGGGAPVYYQTTAEWALTPSLIAERGAIYVYSDKSYVLDDQGNRVDVPGVKIGDGTSYLIDMPFVADDIGAQLLEHIQNTVVHITPQDRVFWDNKISSYVDSGDAENLILSKTNYVLEV